MNFPYLRAMLLGSVWLLEEQYLLKACSVLERRINGERLSDDEIASIKHHGEGGQNGLAEHWAIDAQSFVEAGTAAAAGGGTQMVPVVAVINIAGVIAQHARQVDNISGPGGTSTERVTQSLRAALADPSVKSIVLNFDSPGGNVFGVEALSDEIFRARGQKPIAAQVNSQAASAAYWLATQADEVVVTPGGQVGSIGAYSIHEDLSQKAENEGVKITFVSAGKYKVEGNSFEPLSNDARGRIQAMVDMYYGTFVNAVARGRDVKAEDVRNGFGQGGMEHAKNALKLGMADRIATLDETLRRMASARVKTGGAQATVTTPEAITLERRDGGVFLVGAWPAFTEIDAEFLNSKPEGIEADLETGRIEIAIANGCAVYQRIETRAAHGRETLICKLGSFGHYLAPSSAAAERIRNAVAPKAEAPPPAEQTQAEESPPPEQAQQTAEEREAFRRRRHAHRLRAPD